MTAQEPQKPSTPIPDPSDSRSSRDTSQGRRSDADTMTEGASTDDSPELLRWRADILLDEMMLGAVDAGGSGHIDARPQTPQSDHMGGVGPRVGAYDNGFTSPGHTSPAHTAGTSQSSPSSGNLPRHPGSPPSPAPAHRDDPSRDDPSRDESYGGSYSDAYGNSGDGRAGESARDSRRFDRDEGAQSPRRDVWTESRPGEQADSRATPSPPGAPRSTAEPGADGAYLAYSPRYGYSSPETAPDVDYLRPPHTVGTQNHRADPTTEDALLRPPTAAQGYERTDEDRGRPGSPRREDRSNRRNNLLPRMSAADVAQLRQELTQLTTEVEQALPPGHDWYARSEHLLERADHILRTTPERSAEVEYYLQQVRAILQRAQQTNTASLAYRKRLVFYHVAWLILSSIVLATFVLYRQSLTTWLVTTLRLIPNGFWAGHLAAITATMAAATLGAALGGLWNMQRYLGQGRGFFDRKYGLRGLLLPVFALLAASMVYVLFAFVCWMTNVVPLDSPLWVIAPAGTAFAFGFWQEHIYGTAA